MTQVVTNATTSTSAGENPFIGLRSFDKSDKSNFFGRSKEVKEVLRKLKTTRFLTIVGASGSGKTSLIQAGLVPELMEGFGGQGGNNWGVAKFTPGRNPIGNMANALSQRNVLSPDIKAEPNSNKIEETLRRSSLGLINYVKEKREALQGKNLLLIINQFEELFTLMEDESMVNETRDFVKLLLRAANDKELPIYILIAIEADSLSEITKFRGLPEVVNQGQYLMPRMTKQDLRKVVIFPLERNRIKMDEQLRGTILEEVEYTDDQLPILQHALLRTVEKWEKAKEIAVEENLEVEDIGYTHYSEIGRFSEAFIEAFDAKAQLYENDAPEQSGMSEYEIEQSLLKKFAKRDDVESYVANLLDFYQTRLEIEYYDGLKPMQKALGVHAEEVFIDFSIEEKKVCERIFKAITDGTQGIENVKARPVTINTLAEIAMLDNKDDIKYIIEELRKPGRNFIETSNRDLRGSTTVTLTHASLVRKWDRLKRWVKAETESSKTYMRLAHDAAIHELDEKKQGLWRDNQLKFGENWFEHAKPNMAWAIRYDTNYDTSIRFLEKSIAKRDAELAAKREAEAKEKRMRRRILYIVSTAAVVCLCLAGWAYLESQEAAKSALIAKEKEKSAKLSEYEANNEKVKAAMSAREASLQATIAKTKAKEAKVSQGIAIKKAEEARKAAIKAKAAAEKAAVAEAKAIASGEKAIKEGERARAAEVVAIEKEKIAKIAEAEAQKLKLQKLAEAIAIKSVSINKPIIRGQVAKKAMEIFQASEGLTAAQVNNPEIYTALYFGIKGLKEEKKQKDFNKYPTSKETHRGSIRQIINDGNNIYSAGSDGKILKWTISPTSNKADKPKVTTSVIGNIKETVLSMDFLNGKLITAGKNRRINLFHTTSSKASESYDIHNNRFVWDVDFIDDNTIVSSGQDQNVVSFNLKTKAIKPLFQSNSDIKNIAFDRNNNILAMGDGKGVVTLMNMSEPGKKSGTKTFSGGAITALEFRPDGNYLVVGNERGKLYLVSFPEFMIIKELDTHTFAVTDIQFNTSTTFVTTSRDRTAQYWDIRKIGKGQGPLIFVDHSDWCTAAGFVNGQAMVGCKDGSVNFWALDVLTLSNELCNNMLKDNKIINDNDWEKYIGNDSEIIKKVGKSVCLKN
ncbi:MAG: energy-coupling factor transporter ATP-binding protein EcfA2 [Cognaticolwellia sp.]|jgi:energy-coupling factor transporter ATP-binding protein EcfA2